VSPHAHHQELNNCNSSLWFYLWDVVVAELLVVVGPVITGPAIGRGRTSYNRPDHDQQHCYHHAPKVKAVPVTAVFELLVKGGRTIETC
jgi:hypothetical protein